MVGTNLEESDSYRAVLFNVNNTRFKLKKNDNQKPNPGHLLWYVGQGVWKDADVVSRVIDTAVLGLRKKIERDPKRPRHLLSVRGVGYRFVRRPLTHD